MATVTSSAAASEPAGQLEAVHDLAVGGWSGGGESESKSDRYLARRLAAASADYKGVAVTTFLLGTAVGGFLWLAAGILVEHWLVPGGLPRTVRWSWLAAGIAAVVAAAIRWIVPLVRYRVNLVYAARAIEREHPELHNDLVNTVLVKAHPEGNAPVVVRSLERRAAKRLSDVPAEGVVDRSTALRLACALAVLVGLACVYEVAAPKSLAVSAVRLLAPWVGWAAPSRVHVGPPRLAWRMPEESDDAPDDDEFDRRGVPIDAGRATHVRGRQLVVAAEIRGLGRDERPMVGVAPLRADGGVDHAAPAWKVEMVRGASATGAGGDADGAAAKQFFAVLPDAARGLDASVEIAIAAGDGRSEPVRIAVVDAPTLLVREVRYEYPRYIRRQSETVEWQGDLRGIEGTQVTIVAESNEPLEDAWIDFGCDGSHDLKFGKSANDHTRYTKSFHLHMNADRSGPEHPSYQLRFLPAAASSAIRAKESADAMEHRIEVIADLAPEVSIEEPRESPVRVPPSAPVSIRVRAVDPDFALARVGVETRLKGGATRPEITLFQGEKSGVFKGTARLVPDRLGATPGSVLEYRAVAVDNRPKSPNVSHSPWQSLQIDPSAPPRQQEQESPRSREGQQNPNQQNPGQQNPAQQNQEAGDGRQGQQQQQEGERQQGQRQQGDQQQQQQGEKQQGQQEQGQRQQEQGNKSGASEGSNQGSAQESAGEKQRGDKQGQGQNQGQGADQGQGVGAQGERSGGKQSGKEKQAGNGGKNEGEQGASAGDSSGGQKQGGRENASAKGGDGSRPGERQQGEKQSGDKPGANDQAGGRQPRNTVAADGTNDGEAMERILEHRRQTGGNAADQKQPGKQGSEPGEKSAAGSQSPKQDDGQQQNGGQQQDQGRPSDEQESQNAPQNPAPCAGADGKPCGKEGCSNCSGGGKSGAGGGKSGGQEKSVGENAPNGAAGEKIAGEKGAGSEGAGKEGAGKEGAGKEGAGKEGANGQAGQVGGEKPGPGGQPAQPTAGKPGDSSTPTGSGGWIGGDRQSPPKNGPADGPPSAKELEWGEQDLANARNAANLAVEHLRNAVDSGRTDVLDQLGWTREQARAFLDRWEKMRQMSESVDPADRGAFERAVRSLGLRPGGVRSSRDVPADVRGGQAEGRRSRPPSEYREQFKAYTQGTAGE